MWGSAYRLWTRAVSCGCKMRSAAAYMSPTEHLVQQRDVGFHLARLGSQTTSIDLLVELL